MPVPQTHLNFIPCAAFGVCCPGFCTRNQSAFARCVRQAHSAHSGARRARILRTESFRCLCGQSCAPVGARTVLFIQAICAYGAGASRSSRTSLRCGTPATWTASDKAQDVFSYVAHRSFIEMISLLLPIFAANHLKYAPQGQRIAAAPLSLTGA